MKKSKISFHNAWLAILVFLILTPISSMAEIQNKNMQAQATVKNIDMRVVQVADAMSAIRYDLRKLRMIGRSIEVWFSRLNKINEKIRKVQMSRGEYATFNPSQLDAALQQLKNERTEILKLNGGATIGGQHYTSMEQLKNAHKHDSTLNKKYMNLEDDYEEYTRELEMMELKRKVAFSEMEEPEKNDLTWNRTLLEIYEDEMKELELTVKDKKLWCSSYSFEGSIAHCSTRKSSMRAIRENYLHEILRTPGKKFNSKELAQRIIKERDVSNRVKEEAYSKLFEKIEALKRKIDAEEGSSIDISGCWIIYLSDHDYPQVNIKITLEGYSAYVTNVGVLDHIGQGHMLFEVIPVSKTVFDGWEYGTDTNGVGTISKLRLILSKDGSRMDYRSDDILTMGRCN